MKSNHRAAAHAPILHRRRGPLFSFRVWFAIASCSIALCALAAPAAEAAIVNGGFETATFPPWTFSGGAGVASGAFGTPPHSGTYHALMETGPSAQSSIAALETFLGVPSGSLDAAVNPAPPGSLLVEGSAIRQTGVSVAAGNSITFAWNFLTDEAPSVSDTAFYTLSSGALTGAFFLADPSTPNATSLLTPFAWETGYFTVNTGPLPAGTYTIGFGVADYGVTTVHSGLLIDSVTLIPEPSTLVLAALCLVVLGIFARLPHR